MSGTEVVKEKNMDAGAPFSAEQLVISAELHLEQVKEMYLQEGGEYFT